MFDSNAVCRHVVCVAVALVQMCDDSSLHHDCVCRPVVSARFDSPALASSLCFENDHIVSSFAAVDSVFAVLFQA